MNTKRNDSIRILGQQQTSAQRLYLLEAPPGDTLKIAIHVRSCIDDGPNLLLSLRPLFGHDLAFLIKVFMHVIELFDDDFDPLPKAWAS